MSSETKVQAAASDYEIDPQHAAALKTIRWVDAARVGLTMLGLLFGLTILGTSADVIAVYNTTHIPGMPLWPSEFDLRPAVALVAGSVIIVLASAVSLACSKTAMLRNNAMVHTPVTFAAPFVGFVAAMVAMIFFYAVNASTRVDTLLSWTCQWERVSMNIQPHFGTLCKESKTALYMSIILVPVEALLLSLAAYQMTLERKANGIAQMRKRGSPALS